MSKISPTVVEELIKQTVVEPSEKHSFLEAVDTSNSVDTNSLVEQITSNKTYFYILIVIIILAGIGYYLYTKHFKQDDITSNKTVIDPNNEYYMVDPQGKQILINKYFSNILQAHNNPQPIMVQQPIKQPVKQPRPQLSHPGEDVPNEVNITENEDDNILTQDLTQAEMDELTNQLKIMQKKQGSQITALNDEDGDNESFE
jgi:hypothetical protein